MSTGKKAAIVVSVIAAVLAASDIETLYDDAAVLHKKASEAGVR